MHYSKPFLGKIVKVDIDRPIGSKHPKHNYTYPVNYGYVPNTRAPDGAELDVYILGVKKALSSFSGRCVAILHRIDDDDDKLIICEDGRDFTDEQIQKATHFQEQWFDSEIIR